MKPSKPLGVLAAVLLLAIHGLAKSSQPPQRQVAITIDDLPAGSNTLPAAAITEMTAKLLGICAIRSAGGRIRQRAEAFMKRLAR